MEDSLKEHFPDIYIFVKEIEHNKTQNIEDYFGTKVLMIKGGHGGHGYDVRTLTGYFNDNDPKIEYKKYLEITSPESTSLCETSTWHGDIFLWDRLPELIILTKSFLDIRPMVGRSISLWAIMNGLKWALK